MADGYPVERRRHVWRGAAFRLGLGLGIWWLLVGAAVALTLPEPVRAVPQRPYGSTARVNLPGMVPAHPSLPIPVERAAFDLAQRGYLESNEGMLDVASTAYEWIAVTHGLAVNVVATDGEVVQVELLDGPYAGRRGWLKSSQLMP
jgi:hypothetical protein